MLFVARLSALSIALPTHPLSKRIATSKTSVGMVFFREGVRVRVTGGVRGDVIGLSFLFRRFCMVFDLFMCFLQKHISV